VRVGHLGVAAQPLPGDVLAAGDFDIIGPEDVAGQGCRGWMGSDPDPNPFFLIAAPSVLSVVSILKAILPVVAPSQPAQ
jgi:hypothetical protein